nr:ABC-three component system middle component 8 [Acetobacter persici]
MLRPSKHAHPDRTVINVALVLLKRLQTMRLCDYSTLLAFARKAISGGDVLFLPALNFLFLLGVVEYHPKTDSFEYVGQHEAV